MAAVNIYLASRALAVFPGGSSGWTRVKYGQPTFYAFLYYAHKVVYLREPITVWAINSEKLKIA
jgi:hypothetical protein